MLSPFSAQLIGSLRLKAIPQGLPLIYLWILSAAELNIRRTGAVALAIADSENHYSQAMIRDRVVEDTHEGADEHINKLAKKYLSLDEYPHRQPGEQRVIFKIKPEKVFKIEG